MSPKTKQTLRAAFTMAAFALTVTAIANIDPQAVEKTPPAATSAPAVSAPAAPR